jgi:hypothetical protein
MITWLLSPGKPARDYHYDDVQNYCNRDCRDSEPVI